MTAKVDAAVLSTIANVLEEFQKGVQAEFKAAEDGSVQQEVFSKLDDMLGTLVENISDRIADDQDKD